MKLTEARYKVSKASGSRYAFVVDTKTGEKVARYDVFKGGWEHSAKHCFILNDVAARAALPNPSDSKGHAK